ncbi:MAG: hypothetical protein JWQ98_708 [Chlorobi bacterium]|nr:hypothetical protein [Chlorobiota bacterium]
MRLAGSLLVLALLLFACVPLPAQEEDDSLHSAPIPVEKYGDSTRHRLVGGNHGVASDHSTILIRKPDARRLKKFTDDDDYLYDRKPRDPSTFFQKVLAWLREHLYGKGAGSAPGKIWSALTSWPSVILIGLGLVLLVLRSDGVRGAFFRDGEAVAPGFTEIDENIETMDFDRLIEAAVAARNFRRAVRLHYLKLLKEMGSRKMIALRMEKTNHDYLRELSVPALRDPFAQVTLLFEYVWYGDLPVDETMFRSLRERFAGFDAMLRREA